MKSLKLILTGLILISICFIGIAAAENNTTVNASYSDDSDEDDPIIIYYKDTEQYLTDYAYWYNYYTQDRETGYEATLRDNLRSYMQNTEMSESEKWDAMLILMGFDFRLENYLNTEKRTIDDETGAITYSLGVVNWWMNFFNSGIDESKLPQTLAEGDALKDIYYENYQAYFDLMLEYDTE